MLKKEYLTAENLINLLQLAIVTATSFRAPILAEP